MKPSPNRQRSFRVYLEKCLKILLNTWVLSLLFIFFSIEVQAQEVTVSGTILDEESGESLIGVTVVVKGTTIGTITDFNGTYVLSVPGPESVLVFSYVGYNSTEVTVGNQSEINISLSTNVSELEEIIVVGYGTQKVKDLTSAITTVKTEEIMQTPAAQTMQALQGRVAGVQIVNNGSPGSEPTVRIRGIGSYANTTPPLYVVNGALFDNIDFLNPSEIETLSVLKDASASAIYGVRAANGVVLITTKGGRFNSKPNITYDGYYGLQVPTNVLEMANTEQFVSYVEQTGSAADQSYIDNVFQLWGRSTENTSLPAPDTDWYNEIMNNAAPIQNHSVAITGGTESTAYSFGVSYFAQDGLLKTQSSYDRMNITTKIDQKVNNWFNAGVSFNMSNAVRYVEQSGAWFQAYHAVPVMPVKDEQFYKDYIVSDDSLAAWGSPYATARNAGYRGVQNPYYTLDYNENRLDIKKIQANVYGELVLLDERLKFKTNYNLYTDFIRSRNFNAPYIIVNKDVAQGEGSRDASVLSSGRSNTVNQYWDNTLTYAQDIGDHGLSAMIGTSFRDEAWNSLFGNVDGVPLEEYLRYVNSNLSPLYDDTRDVVENGSRLYGMSYFGRLSYDYKNRYLAYFTLRRDGSQKYQEKWGTFPAFGLGWVISEENFFQKVGFVDFLKIRGGWGKLGTDAGAREDGALSVNLVNLAINDQQTTGSYSTSTFGYLSWEVVVGTNIGFTAEILKSRLSIDADYYIRDTENAIIPVSLKLQAGSVRKNAGGIRNSGVELTMNWNDRITNDLSYSLGLNMAYNKNEVTDLFGQEFLNAGQAEFRQRSEVGQPLFSFYGYETAGVYQNQAELDADPVAVTNGLVAGDLRFKDQNNDDVIDDLDKVYLGSYMPTMTYGGSLGLSYKNLSFTVAFMGQYGNKILNRKRGEIIWTNDTNIDADLATGLWNGEGTSNKYPSASGLRRGWNQNFSDYLVEDGAFFRIQNVQIAYTLNNDSFFSGMPETRIYVTADKPLTLFKYNGFSPEIPTGIDRQFHPIPATYRVGLNVKF